MYSRHKSSCRLRTRYCSPMSSGVSSVDDSAESSPFSFSDDPFAVFGSSGLVAFCGGSTSMVTDVALWCTTIISCGDRCRSGVVVLMVAGVGSVVCRCRRTRLTDSILSRVCRYDVTTFACVSTGARALGTTVCRTCGGVKNRSIRSFLSVLRTAA